MEVTREQRWNIFLLLSEKDVLKIITKRSISGNQKVRMIDELIFRNDRNIPCDIIPFVWFEEDYLKSNELPF